MGLSQRGFIMQVISLKDRGIIGNCIEDLNIPVFSLNMQSGQLDFRSVIKLVQLLRKLQPNLVQTWMYHADLLGGIAARLAGIRRVVWNIRQSDFDPKFTKLSTQLVIRINARFSHWLPDHILCCSERTRCIHNELGYRNNLIQVIPNGIDTDVFYPCPIARLNVRLALGIAPSTFLIGLIARYDPQKDHAGFLIAAIALASQRHDCAFLLCGKDITWENSVLAEPIKASGLSKQFFLLGPRSDIAAIHTSCDLEVCASAYGEGFPNVIGEAMACMVPCVVTDVGDAAHLVDNTGFVVPPRNTQAMIAALDKLLNFTPQLRQVLGVAARNRIKQNYSLMTMVERYIACYQTLIV